MKNLFILMPWKRRHLYMNSSYLFNDSQLKEVLCKPVSGEKQPAESCRFRKFTFQSFPAALYTHEKHDTGVCPHWMHRHLPYSPDMDIRNRLATNTFTPAHVHSNRVRAIFLHFYMRLQSLCADGIHLLGFGDRIKHKLFKPQIFRDRCYSCIEA